jgi:hypothetical protein
MNRKRKTFMWREIRSWGAFIRGLMPRGVPEQLAKVIRQQQELFRYSDDPDALKSIYSSFSDFASLVERFAATFDASFSHVGMFHCCRPWQIEAYYREGIRVLSADEANEYFRSFCRTTNGIPNITENDMTAAIDSMITSYGRFGQIYFGLDDRFLIEHCGHYLIYGSEYLQSLCSHLRTRIRYDLRSQLKQVGIPTVFQVRIPVIQFENHELSGLADYALPAWAYCIAHDRPEPGMLDFAIKVGHAISPDDILGHYHPHSPRLNQF